jgi:fused signal recognition particle receptor
MAFFKKLKDRLLRSSSKIDEGLEAIVEDGGQEDEVTAQDVVEPEPQVEVVEVPEPIQGEPKNLEVEAPKIIEPQPVIETTQVPPIEAEQAFSTAEREDRHEHLAPSEPEPEPEPEQIAAEPVVVQEAIVPALEPVAKPETVSTPDTPGLIGRLFGRTEKKTVVRRVLDDDMLEQLEELLIATDMGVDTALRVTSNMAEGRMGKKLSVDEIKSLLAAEIARIMEPVARPMPIYPKTPQVVLVVGVNGSGKTTTIGKLACQFKAAGKQVVIAAGDTFRAAAVEQLQVWGDRAGVPVLTAPEGSDPASLAFDAMTKAQEDGADLLMIDTAGRLQNRSDLMEELEKIVRVIRKKDPTAPHNTLLVLDATTGQNALNQVKVFQEVSDVSGLVMTKLDGTAKGGVLVALADKFGLPIHAIGVGEQIDDLEAFDPDEFAAALTGAEPK